MNQEFMDLISIYEKDLNQTEIKNYILKNIYIIENIKDYIDLFLETATKLNDLVGMALANSMYFWVYHGSDLEYANKYLEKALSIYKKIDNYQDKIGYLSTLNNLFIYNNYNGHLKKVTKL